jgi:hypothetical protein
MFLVSIIPPSNIRSTIYAYQLSLFRETGRPAALALPPHLPIAFYENPPDSPGSLIQMQSFESGGFVIIPPWRLIEVQPFAEIERLRSVLPAADTGEWYPVMCGIPVSDAALECATREDQAPVVRWRTSQLVCMDLQVENQERWWEYVEYTPIWRVKLKRRID